MAAPQVATLVCFALVIGELLLGGGMRRSRPLLYAEVGAGALLALRWLLIGAGSSGGGGGGRRPGESAAQRRKSMV